MLSTRLMPLRSTVGDAIPLGEVAIDRHSGAFQKSDVTLRRLNALAEIGGLDFTDYLPDLHERLGNRTSEPIAGSGRVPIPQPENLPFRGDLDFVSLQVLLKKDSPAQSRDLWLELEFRFREARIVGGICYMGLPQLPYRITPQGENSANFGLPREIRLIWARTDGGFIDDERVTTRQEPASHSGVHLLCTEPLRTDRLIVRLGDWPRLITRFDMKTAKVGCTLDVIEQAGLVIPMIFPFTYEEKTRYRAHVPMGVLASVKSPAEGPNRYLCKREGTEVVAAQAGAMNSSYLYRADTAEGHYFTLCDASAANAGRRFEHEGRALIERYLSVPLELGELVRFYVEQTECNPRCIAGIRLRFDRMQLDGIAEQPKTGISVYELDLLEGMSAVDLSQVPEENKYATLLYEDAILPAESERTCRFRRPSLSRHFVIEFKSLSSRRSQICIAEMSLVQSAGVTITPRKSRTQVVQNMHFRLIGADLATDYACIGEGGFTLSVETNVSGQRTGTLFQAISLLDLVQSGSARIIANQRRMETVKAVTLEVAETHSGSYDETERYARSRGWRRSETGDGIRWDESDAKPAAERGKDDPEPVDGTPDGEHGFESIHSSELRTQTEHIANEGLPAILETFEPVLQLLFPDYSTEQITTELPRLLAADESGFDWNNKAWRGIRDVDFQAVLAQLSLPPWLYAPQSGVEGLADAIQDIAAWIQDPLSVPSGPNIEAVSQLYSSIPVVGVANGLGIGLSLGFQAGAGGSFSFSGDRLLPALGYTATRGRAGAIAKQANKTGYSYNQHLNSGYERTRGRTDFLSSRMERTTTRMPNQEGTEDKRTAGAEVMWQERLTDIVIGRVPLNVTLPATADNLYRTADHSLTVRLGSHLPADLSVDVWFDIAEEIVREDY